MASTPITTVLYPTLVSHVALHGCHEVTLKTGFIIYSFLPPRYPFYQFDLSQFPPMPRPLFRLYSQSR